MSELIVIMKPKLVIVNSAQFGYHIDTYYYCKYLKSQYAITYICWDHGRSKIDMPGVLVHYVGRGGGLSRVVRFLSEFYKITRSPDTIIFIKYFKIITTVMRLLRSKNPLVLDIRSGSVTPIGIKRFFEDVLLMAESKFFTNITVISKSLAKRLALKEKAQILSLGADTLSKSDKRFNELHLLYVGTLYNRKIEKAVKGFSQFYRSHKDKCNIKFTIIGSGSGNELDQIKELSQELGVADVVNVVGRIPHDQLKPYFDTHNIGVSYVPLTPYYDVQPVTKTFEYLLSGMPVLATATSENKLVINQANGVLTDDTPDGVSKGLSKIYDRRMSYDSDMIRQGSMKYCWGNIVSSLARYFQTL